METAVTHFGSQAHILGLIWMRPADGEPCLMEFPPRWSPPRIASYSESDVFRAKAQTLKAGKIVASV